jgi:hypothetical protein
MEGLALTLNLRKVLCIACALVIIATLITFPLPTRQGTHQLARVQSASGTASANIVVFAQIPPKYSIFDLSATEYVSANITLSSLNSASTQTVEFISSFSPYSITVEDQLQNGTFTSLPVIILTGTFGTFVGYSVNIPAGSSMVSAQIQGTQNGESFVFRQVTNVPFVVISGLGTIPETYTILVAIPHGSVISQAYTGGGLGGTGGLSVPIPQTGANYGSYVAFSVPPQAGSLVIESVWYRPVTAVIFALSAVAIALVLVDMLPVGKKKLIQFVSLLRHNRITLWLVGLTARLHLTGGGLLKQKILAQRKQLQPKNLLVLFLLLGTLMISLAALTGPDPHYKVYVIADPATANQIGNNLNALIGNVQVITPGQDYSDFDVMSSTGMFNMVVVSAYPTLATQEVSKFVLPNLGNVPLIVVDKSANSTFVSQIEALYLQKTIVVQNAASLNSSEAGKITGFIQCCAGRGTNIVSLQISNSGFESILALEAFLSFVLILLGAGFLGAKAVEPGSDSSLTHVADIVALGIFMFFFSEVIYVVTSTILRFPLSLHAVISGAETITATGIMGKVVHLPLGGGSTPRDLAAVVGLAVGALSNGWGRVFSGKSLLFLTSVGLALYFNPFVIGNYVFQGLLLFVGNVSLGPITNNLYTFKDFLYGFGGALGGNTSPVYLLSAGKIVYFAGMVPLAFINRMKKNTATMTLLVAAVLLGHGAIRVGEMTPDKTVIALLPGLFAGFAFALVLLLISRLEKYVTSSYRGST